jgi:hypothetical protein
MFGHLWYCVQVCSSEVDARHFKACYQSELWPPHLGCTLPRQRYEAASEGRFEASHSPDTDQSLSAQFQGPVFDVRLIHLNLQGIHISNLCRETTNIRLFWASGITDIHSA